jgi:two-component sensor histidine kinase
MKLLRFNLHLSPNQIKFLLVALASVIIGTVLLYTHILVDEMRQQENKIVVLYADAITHFSSLRSESNEDWTFFLDNILKTINFPVILTDVDDQPLLPYKVNIINVGLDTTLTQEEQQLYLVNYIEEMRQVYDPILITDDSGNALMKLYYTNSYLITKLQLLPYIEIFVVSIFILMGYIGFNYIKRTEQSYVWVGLAKEAAHQLGTPLSSMLAWIEIMKINVDDPRQVEEVLDEMKHDIDRLNKIAHRFSKIGSKPEMRRENLAELIEKVSQYFEHRLPHLGKRVEIIRELDPTASLDVNAELFEWVIENLIKNGAESMESGKGVINISLKAHNGRVAITVHDNGKGMSPTVKRQAFNPGFSTKKRGWGLGLSLCRRIIEEYHGGRIFIRDTAPGKGTTFAIELTDRAVPNRSLPAVAKSDVTTAV